jgi:CheY-like chemotaxis protein
VIQPSRILIIDDEARLRETMQLALDAVGYRTETAADGAEGLEKFGAGPEWDLVLLDQRMPGMEGLEVLSRIRERDPEARVVMVTAYGTIELAVDAMRAGAVDFLRKPFTPETLRGAAAMALAHPRRAPEAEAADLTRLMPKVPHAGPLIQFRTLNGYKFWAAPLPPGGQETEALRVRRGYEVQSPGGERRRCAVEVTTSVRTEVEEDLRRAIPPEDPLWDSLCNSALADFLWQKAESPPASLPVYSLTREQVHTLRALVGREPGGR